MSSSQHICFYYQIGGREGHTFGWDRGDQKKVADNIFKHVLDYSRKCGPIELVLGILSNGASYLLLTSSQMDYILAREGQRYRKNLKPPYTASRYSSLSPIYFTSVEELLLKIKTYSPGSQSSVRPVSDTSRANKAYFMSSPLDKAFRARFEQHRMLYHVITTPGVDFDKFSLGQIEWLAATPLLVLSLSIWEADSYDNRKDNPKILDIGWMKVPLMAFREDYKAQLSESSHVLVEENVYLRNSSLPYTPFKLGTTETLKTEDIKQRLLRFFGDHEDIYRIFVLVNNAKRTCAALRTIGINTTDWSDDVSVLLKRDAMYRPSRHDYSHQRSDSPEEGVVASDGNDILVYLIDIEELVGTLLAMPLDWSLGKIAEHLALPTIHPNSNSGDNCIALIDAWRIMLCGNAIDEHRKNMKGRRTRTRPEQAQAREVAGEGSNIDPNDVQVQPNRQRSKIAAWFTTSDDDDDDDDYL